MGVQPKRGQALLKFSDSFNFLVLKRHLKKMSDFFYVMFRNDNYLECTSRIVILEGVESSLMRSMLQLYYGYKVIPLCTGR